MKLLIDQNLSPDLVKHLADLCPDSAHVLSLGLDCSSDDALWDHARVNDYVIVSKDADFNNLAVVRGYPPKVIWLLLGNCTTAQVEGALRSNHTAIEAFFADPDLGTLALR